MTATTVPTPEQQQQHEAWDSLLLDIETRSEQVRQLKQYEPWRLAAALVSSAAVAGSAVAGLILWAAHLLQQTGVAHG